MLVSEHSTFSSVQITEQTIENLPRQIQFYVARVFVLTNYLLFYFERQITFEKLNIYLKNSEKSLQNIVLNDKDTSFLLYFSCFISYFVY